MTEVKPIHDIIEEVVPYYKEKGGPEAKHQLVYDSSSETLEPIYFFILDLMNDFGLNPEKLVDNFTSSPGSGHFSELGQKATMMQQQASKIMGDVNTVLRSVLNIIYDLKEFKTRLLNYEDLNSSDKNKSQSARLALKQIWLDKVDIQKGNSSVKAMTFGQGGFTTLLDAFLIADDEKSAEGLDLNDRVKRIVKQRINEFNNWLEQSEKELKKRYNIEKAYLKSQSNSLKLYSRWVKPYLKAAFQLEQGEMGRNAALVKTFNTILLELTLFGKSSVNVGSAAASGDLPPELANKSIQKQLKRKYYTCILMDFVFRGIPQKVSQRGDYSFGGRTEVTFRAYALNEDEIKKFEKELEKSDMEDVLKLIEGASGESIEQLQKEIDYFLEEKEDEEKKKEEKLKSQDVNPFLALIGHYDKPEENKKEDKKNSEEEIKIHPENWLEKEHIRKYTAAQAQDTLFKLFDVYKKAHGMPSYT